MKKYLIAALLVSLPSIALAGTNPLYFFGTDDVSTGVLCKIKNISVLAKEAGDCAKLGGVSTHQLKQVAIPLKK